jgi:hypothetical protein
MSTKPIRRITLFKVPKPEDQEALLDIYRTMPEKAVKVGKFKRMAEISTDLGGFQFRMVSLTYYQ